MYVICVYIGAIKENLVDPLTLSDYLLFLLNRKEQVRGQGSGLGVRG